MAKKELEKMTISDSKKKTALKALSEAKTLSDVKASVDGLEAAERNALAPYIKDAIDKIVGL